MTRKVQIEAGRDASVDQSVGKEAVTVEKVSLLQDIFGDKGKLAIVTVAAVMISEIVLLGVLAICGVEAPNFLESLMIGTLAVLAGVCGAQRINGAKVK